MLPIKPRASQPVNEPLCKGCVITAPLQALGITWSSHLRSTAASRYCHHFGMLPHDLRTKTSSWSRSSESWFGSLCVYVCVCPCVGARGWHPYPAPPYVLSRASCCPWRWSMTDGQKAFGWDPLSPTLNTKITSMWNHSKLFYWGSWGSELRTLCLQSKPFAHRASPGPHWS